MNMLLRRHLSKHLHQSGHLRASDPPVVLSSFLSGTVKLKTSKNKKNCLFYYIIGLVTTDFITIKLCMCNLSICKCSSTKINTNNELFSFYLQAGKRFIENLKFFILVTALCSEKFSIWLGCMNHK